MVHQTYISIVSSQAREIVRSVMRGDPLKTFYNHHEIFSAAVEQFPDAVQELPQIWVQRRDRQTGEVGVIRKTAEFKASPVPKFQDHPIRSMRFLKKFVLEDMAERGQVEKVHVLRGPVDESGNHMDLIKYRAGKSEVLNLIEEKQAWMWRLVHDRDRDHDQHTQPTETQEPSIKEWTMRRPNPRNSVHGTKEEQRKKAQILQQFGWNPRESEALEQPGDRQRVEPPHVRSAFRRSSAGSLAAKTPEGIGRLQDRKMEDEEETSRMNMFEESEVDGPKEHDYFGRNRADSSRESQFGGRTWSSRAAPSWAGRGHQKGKDFGFGLGGGNRGYCSWHARARARARAMEIGSSGGSATQEY